MIQKKQILIATKNLGKFGEMQKLLRGLPFHLRSLNEFPDVFEVEETGATFEENAILKAREYARQTKISALADDSGLEIAALGNAPGVFSARYAGNNSTDAEKISKLLKELEDKSDRRARFVCVMALADETGKIIYSAEGICNGKIALSASGINGFGYDPIFIPEGFDKTFGELPSNIKQKISHRAQAIKQIIRFFQDF